MASSPSRASSVYAQDLFPPEDVPPPPEPQRVLRPQISLQEPSAKKKSLRPGKLFRRVRAVFRSFPIITPVCKMPSSMHGGVLHEGHIHGGIRMTGTLFGYRKTRVSLAIQENSRCLPMLILELAIPTARLLQEMGSGLVRIALESEKLPGEKTKLIDIPIWTMY